MPGLILAVHRALLVYLVVKVYLDLLEMIMDYLDRLAHLALMARQELQAHLVHRERQVTCDFSLLSVIMTTFCSLLKSLLSFKILIML